MIAREIILRKEKKDKKDRRYPFEKRDRRIEKALKHFIYEKDGEKYKLSVLGYNQRFYKIAAIFRSKNKKTFIEDLFLTKKLYHKLLKGDFIYGLTVWKNFETNESWLVDNLPKPLSQMILDEI